MAIALMRAGKRVGVTSLSHKAIHNLLRAIEHEAERQGFEFRGAKSGDEDSANTAFDGRSIETSEDSDVCADPTYDLVAGTAWALTAPRPTSARPSGRSTSSSSTRPGSSRSPTSWRSGTSARSLVLLGDPNQLPQVSQGTHPEGPSRSVLQHLLGEHVTVPPDRGLFLERDVPIAARALRLHVRRVLRGSPRLRAGRGASVAAGGERPGMGARRAHRPGAVVGGGGGRDRADRRRAPRDGLHGCRRLRASADRDGHPRRGAVQRPGADAPFARFPTRFPSARSTSSRASRRRSSSSRWRARRRRTRRAGSASRSTGTGSTLRPRGRSAQRSSSARRASSTPTVRP